MKSVMQTQANEFIAALIVDNAAESKIQNYFKWRKKKL